MNQYNVYLEIVGEDNRPVVNIYLKGYEAKSTRIHVTLGMMLSQKDEAYATGEFLASFTQRQLEEAGGTKVSLIMNAKGDGVKRIGYGYPAEEVSA